MPGTLFVVATPIGNLEDITVRALRVLREVAVIAAEDTRRTAHLLARYAITTPTTSLHHHNESAKSAAIIDRLQRGDAVALVSDAGTPTVSDPGRQLIREAIAAGIRVEPVPGPSAVLAALTASGFETDSFTFLGFPPTRAKHRNLWFEKLSLVAGTIVFFEAPHRIVETLGDLERLVGDCEASISRELTKAHEETVRGQISLIKQHFTEPLGEFTIVIRVTNPERVPARDEDVIAEFGEMTAISGFTKRKAVGLLARRHGLQPNRVYALIEAAKKSGK